MTKEGLAGVSQHYLFDDYWPGSTETCIWKNVIGILTECASVKYATPIFIEPNELKVRGKDLLVILLLFFKSGQPKWLTSQLTKFQKFCFSRISICAVIMLLIIFSGSRSFADVGSFRIVLKEFGLRGTIPSNQLDSFYEGLKNKLYESTECTIITGRELDNILDKNDIVKEDCNDFECLSKIGKLSKSPIVVSGLIIVLKNEYYLEIFVINANDSKLLITDQVKGPLSKFETDASRKTAEIISSVIEKNYAKTKVSILSDPSGASVSVDGDKIGETPLDVTDLRQGMVYQIIVEKQGFESHEESFKPGERKNKINVVLTTIKGTLSITGWPRKSKVFINNKYAGKLPYLTYQGPQGSYYILVKKFGYRKYEQKIYISSKTTRDLNINLGPKPKIPSMIYSAIIPGSGQLIRGHPFRGLLFLAATVGVGYLAYQEHLVFDQQYKTYQRDLDRFNHRSDLKLIEKDRQRVWDSFNLMKEKEKKRNEILYALGAVWTINVLEIVIE